MSNISEQTKDMELKAHRDLVESARMSKALLLRKSLGKPTEALKEYEYLIAANPGNYEAILGKSMVLLDLERMEEAKVLLQQLVISDTPQKAMAQSLINQIGE